ncbi:hypothetical protein CVT25_007857 [Psilocybe cyanescens]|uniref:Zn(2)-C6 fungal-type domain-containing protein n=1 Tax=Psilocybe cyanescens TaxID=93625 RepID=A0A409XR54_PSICY|nr:hypothetical protein CVT25_007857 [Psilocybe cyanescens]
MSNNTIFTNSDSLIGAMLHLDNLFQKGANNGNIVEVLKSQKKGLRNVLTAKEDSLFKETFAAHGNLFFWTPLYDYYSVFKNPDFNPAEFVAKYKKSCAEQRELHMTTTRAEGSDAGGGKESDKREEETVRSGEITQGGAGVGKDRGSARQDVGLGTDTEKRGEREMAGPAAIPVPVPVQGRPRPRPCPRAMQVMQINTNPVKAMAHGPGPQEASGSKGRPQLQKMSGSKPRAKPKPTQVRDAILDLSTSMGHHLLALQMFDVPEPASTHTFRHIAPPPPPTTSQQIRPPSIELSRMTITLQAKKASRALHPVAEDAEMDDGTDSDRHNRSARNKPAMDTALAKKCKRSAEPVDNNNNNNNKDDDAEGEDEDEEESTEDDDNDNDDPRFTKALPGSRRQIGTANRPTHPAPKCSNRTYAVMCLRCKRKKLECVHVEGCKSSGSCYYCALSHMACRTEDDKEGKKGKGKGKGKGKATKVEGKATAQMPAAKRARMDEMSRSAFNPALRYSDITLEDIERWRALDEIVPQLEDRIEKLEEVVAGQKRAMDKAREQLRKNTEVIQKFDDEIGDLCNAVADLEGRVARLQRQPPSAWTASTSSATISGSGTIADGAETAVPTTRPRSLPIAMPAPHNVEHDSAAHQAEVESLERSTANIAASAPASAPLPPLIPVIPLVPAQSPTVATDIAAAASHISSGPHVPPESVTPAQNPDSYLHRKFDPNHPSHGCIYHNVTGAVIWRYNSGPSTVATPAIEDVDMEQQQASLPAATLVSDQMQTEDDLQLESPPRAQRSTPTQSSASSQLSLPVATSSSEGYRSRPPYVSGFGADSALSMSTSNSQPVVVITRRPTPVSPLSHRRSLVDHDTEDEMDDE